MPGSVMNEAVSPNEAFSGLSDFDEQAIQTLYAAADIAADDETDAPVDTEDHARSGSFQANNGGGVNRYSAGASRRSSFGGTRFRSGGFRR